MDYTDTNKLIAEFMKVPKGKHFHYDIEPFDVTEYSDVEDLKYDISWDWLKPVVDEIEMRCQGVPQELLHLSLFSPRQEVYKAVVEFIKFYNNQNK